LPDFGKIFIASSYLNGESLNLFDSNHNVFRVNSQNKIIWQVRRDDSIMPPDWWDTMHAIARKNGHDGERAPFMYITLEYPDGTNNRADQSGSPPDEAIWTHDCTIWLSGSLSRDYILDPDTGIAKNMTPGFVRDW
ncbi:MAG: hypothetical protein LBF16_06025, partial [Pseudomonadales bacterium]|nr:hypothetical protein [Pseudomonadales bacterium]